MFLVISMPIVLMLNSIKEKPPSNENVNKTLEFTVIVSYQTQLIKLIIMLMYEMGDIDFSLYG